MMRLAYPPSTLCADYLRAAAGLVPSAAILLTVRPAPVVAAMVAAIAALFLLFGIRTGLRQMTRIELDETAIRTRGPHARSLAWCDLDGLRLAYFSTRRDRAGGWLQLELRAHGSNLRLDSRIGGFALVVERAARAAARRGLPLDAATATNLKALGIETATVRPIVGIQCEDLV